MSSSRSGRKLGMKLVANRGNSYIQPIVYRQEYYKFHWGSKRRIDPEVRHVVRSFRTIHTAISIESRTMWWS